MENGRGEREEEVRDSDQEVGPVHGLTIVQVGKVAYLTDAREPDAFGLFFRKLARGER